MNDDIDNDIEIQLVPLETSDVFVIKHSNSELESQSQSPIAESLHGKLFYLQRTTNTLENEEHLFDSLSNSPLSLSGNNSVVEGERKNTTYKKLTYEEIAHSIQKNYMNEKLGSQLDILITFVKGQKHLYTQSYHITKQKINTLVFPSLFLSGSMMVIAPILQPAYWSGYFLSGLNALLTIFTSVLNFWNLQLNLNQYHTCANHFDRLETSLIMTRNQLFLMDNVLEKNERVIRKIQETETRMLEMKEENSILIPAEIQLQAPIIAHIDIFSFMHKIENKMKSLLVSYKDTKNEIRYIMYKWKTRDYTDVFVSHNPDIDLYPDQDPIDTHNHDHDDIHSIIDTHSMMDNTYYRSFMNVESRDPSQRKEHEIHRLQLLLQKKDTLKQQILEQYQKYTGIDRVFSEEIQHAESISYFFSWGFCQRTRNIEPILREFMETYG